MEIIFCTVKTSGSSPIQGTPQIDGNLKRATLLAE